MRKIITVTGIIVIAAIAIAWSRSDRQGASKEPAASVSPHEIMVKQGKDLPTQEWADLL